MDANVVDCVCVKRATVKIRWCHSQSRPSAEVERLICSSSVAIFTQQFLDRAVKIITVMLPDRATDWKSSA